MTALAKSGNNERIYSSRIRVLRFIILETRPLAMSKSELNLRFAKSKEDIDFLWPLLLELHDESRFRDIPLARAKCDRLLSKAFDNPDQYALVLAETGDGPIGFVFCSVGEFLVGTDDLMTTVFAFYVRERARATMIGGRAAIRLLSTIIEWSRKRRSREVMIHVTSGIDIQRADKFLRRARFKVVGANYAFSLAG